MKKLSIALALAALFAQPLCAQNSILVQAPEVVAVGEQFNIVFTIEGEKAGEFSWPSWADFDILWGPQSGTSTSISIINGKRTSSTTTSYTYVLQPKSAGTFTIPQASAKVKGRTIQSTPRTIKVVASSGDKKESEAGAEDLFLSLTVSKRNVVVGEMVTAEIKLFQRVNIAGFEDVHFPGFDGFWSQELEAPQNVEFHRENIGSEIYNVALLRSYKLIPQQTGSLTIDPAKMVCLVNVRSRSTTGNSIFDSFFESDFKTIRRPVSSHPVTLNVSPLPQGAPASFCGGVGKYTMRAALSRDSLSVHDAASLVVKVTGSGNTMLLEAPKINFPPDFESYDVKVTDEGDTRIFEYPFIPRSSGKFVFSPVEFSYYDLESGKYKTIASEPLSIAVAKGAMSAASNLSQSFSGIAAREIRDIGSDIRFISLKQPSLRPVGRFFVGSGWFWALCIVIVAAFALCLCLTRKIRKERADVALIRNKKASKMALQRLASANEYLGANLGSAFYEELHRALTGFALNALTLSRSQSSRDSIAQGFLDKGVAKEDVTGFVELLDACEQARYSPQESHDQMRSHYDDALRLISDIGSSMKHHKSSSRSTAAAGLGLLALLLFVPSVGLKAQEQGVQEQGVQGQFPSSKVQEQFPASSAQGQFPSLKLQEQLWDAANAEYASNEIEAALGHYLEIEATGMASAPLYYNIGCAYFKTGDISHSILYFERALKIDPSFPDAKANLAFARTFIQDRLDAVPEFFLIGWGRSIRHIFTSDGWAVIFIVMLALALGCALLFLLGRRRGLRKGGFVGMAVCSALCIVTILFSVTSRRESQRSDEAIVVAGVSPVRSAPDTQTGTDLFVLHEGTKVKVLDSIGQWRNVSLCDGRVGWIRSVEIEII